MLAPCVLFCNGLEELRSYLGFLDVAQVNTELLPEGLTGNALRQYRYSTAILNLYGGLEQYIEGLMIDCLRELVDHVASYEELDDRVRASHSRLSIEFLPKIDQTRFRGKLTIASVVKKLHSDLSNDAPCVINEEPFIHHSSNFRMNVIDDYFTRVFDGHIAETILKTGEIQQWLKDAGFDFPPFYLIDDLCDRRNEIAHGATSNLLSSELINRYIDYIEFLGRLINDAVYSLLFDRVYSTRSTPLGAAAHVFNNTIACFAGIDVSIKVSDIIVCKNSDGLSRPSNILEMQVDHVVVDSIPTIDAVGVGIQLEIRVKDTFEFFLLPTLEARPLAPAQSDLATEEPTTEEDDEDVEHTPAAPSPAAGG